VRHPTRERRNTHAGTLPSRSEDGSAAGGRALNKHQLAQILRRFGVYPQKWREGQLTSRGYFLTDLEVAFSLYLP
jgi:hypothetical protein